LRAVFGRRFLFQKVIPLATSLFSLGKDCTLVLIAPTGARVDLSIVTAFDSKQTVKTIHVDPLNGPPQEAHLPAGWNGTFTIDRASSAAEDLFTQIEQNYWAGGNFGWGQIYQYITERDGSQSTYLYSGVTLYLSESGSWHANDSVKQTITFFASTRKRV
jgi:hypothetical protein